MTTLRELAPDLLVEMPERTSAVKPYAMSHGTLECRSLKASRQFYEQFLGLECVQHGPISMAVRCGMKFHIVCVETGDRIHGTTYLSHWGLDVDSRDLVDAARVAAEARKDEFGIQKITDTVDQHGVYSFYMEDLDGNWWEIQYFDGGLQHDNMFDFGDVFKSGT